MNINELSGEQIRQAIDAEQLHLAYRDAHTRLDRRFSGAMSWKTVSGRQYLYRKRRDAWKSLGPRDAQTEAIHRHFHEGREQERDRVTGLAARLDAMAPVNRALRLGRMPLIAGRILRALSTARLGDSALCVVGTNALFAYESLAGVQIDSAYLATGDIDLLFDARTRLKLLTPEVSSSGVMGVLRKLDRSFHVVGGSGFRAANRDGYLVDLIMPTTKDRMASPPRSRIGSEEADLYAVEIEGLSWLVNSPKTTRCVIDARGYPLDMRAPDPRAFALHKAWLAERPDRDPGKRRRDRAQAELVAALVAHHLPHLTFDDPALGALPAALRAQAASLVAPDDGAPRLLEPDW